MSFLKKNGQQKWVKEVKGRKYIPGYWYTYNEYVPKYVSGGNGGPTTPNMTGGGAIFFPQWYLPPFIVGY